MNTYKHEYTSPNHVWWAVIEIAFEHDGCAHAKFFMTQCIRGYKPSEVVAGTGKYLRVVVGGPYQNYDVVVEELRLRFGHPEAKVRVS